MAGLVQRELLLPAVPEKLVLEDPAPVALGDGERLVGAEGVEHDDLVGPGYARQAALERARIVERGNEYRELLGHGRVPTGGARRAAPRTAGSGRPHRLTSTARLSRQVDAGILTTGDASGEPRERKHA